PVRRPGPHGPRLGPAHGPAAGNHRARQGRGRAAGGPAGRATVPDVRRHLAAAVGPRLGQGGPRLHRPGAHHHRAGPDPRLPPRWRWATGGAAACLACLLGAEAWREEYPEWLWQPLLALAPVALALTLANSGLLARVGTVLVTLTGRCRVQALVLVLGGATL